MKRLILRVSNMQYAICKSFFVLLLTAYCLPPTALQAQTYTNIFTYNGTSAATRDSINFGFDASEIVVFNDATATDTMFVSTDSLFAADKTFKRVGGACNFATILYKNITTTIIYVKFGVYATAAKKYRVEVLR